MSGMDQEPGLLGLSRRFAQISVPGITEPKVIQGNFSLRETEPHNSPEHKQQQQKLRVRARAREQMLIQSEIESVEFNLYSTEEIDIYSVVNVTNPDKEGPGTVRDLKMGPHSEN